MHDLPPGNAIKASCAKASSREPLSFGRVIYAALLWVYDLLGPFSELADPADDEEGLTLSASRERSRARETGELDSDF